MAYFGASQRMVGDPGFFGTLGRIARGAVGAGVGFATGGIGGAIAGSGLFGRPSGGRVPRVPTGTPKSFTVTPSAIVPGGAPFVTTGGGMPRRRGRRMNPMNPKALRRANTRIDRFVRDTRKLLKHTNYKLVTKSSGTRAKKDLGRGHTHVR